MSLVPREETRLDRVCFHTNCHAGPQQIIDAPARRECERRVAPKHPCGLGKSEMVYPRDEMQPRFETAMMAEGHTWPGPCKKRPCGQVGGRTGRARISESKSQLTLQSEPTAEVASDICT